MRIILPVATLLVSLSACTATLYAHGDGPAQAPAPYTGDACDPCDPCADGCPRGGLFFHGHKHHKGARFDGLQPGFNCGCNGSYKYPVPPLYTYHWPGMWSAQLMTDYHSPWRFPPLKPYVDEETPPAMGQNSTTARRILPVSATIETRPQGTFSRQLEALSR